MNELFLGFPIWYYSIASIIVSFVILRSMINNDTFNFFILLINLITFGGLGIILIPAVVLDLIFRKETIDKIYEWMSNQSKPKTKKQEPPIELFTCFDSNSDIKYYSIKQGGNEIEIKTTSLEFVQDIKECLERSEITWDYVSNYTKKRYGHNLIAIESKIEDIKINRITNKIKID